MRLAAVMNIWDGNEHLAGVIKCFNEHVDEIIIVYQNTSNFGEVYFPLPDIADTIRNPKVTLVKYDPMIEMGGTQNEMCKRQWGINKAIELDCTHYFLIDTDEYYENFGEAKRLYEESGHAGSVVRLHTYFKKPTWRFDRPEDYYVPFIHRLDKKTRAGSYAYPFYVDPTRKVNETDVVEVPVFMHHFSWVRKDIHRKARNSSASLMINEKIWNDYNNPECGPGTYLLNWQRTLIEAPDTFGLSEMFP